MEINQLFRDYIAGQIGRRKFEMWFSSDVCFSVVDGKVSVSVPTSFHRGWIQANYLQAIVKATRALLGRTFPVEFTPTLRGNAGNGNWDLDWNQGGAQEGDRDGGRAENRSGDVSGNQTILTPAAKDAQANPPVRSPQVASLSLFPIVSYAPPAAGRPLLPGDSPAREPTAGEPGSTVGKHEPVIPGQSPVRERSLSVSGTGKSRPRYPGRPFATLGSFVPGLSNRLAKSLADIAVSKPGTINPILVYGATSVGKTHLLEGIYSEYRGFGGRRVPKFMSAGEFASLYIRSLRRSGVPADAEKGKAAGNDGGGEAAGFRMRFGNISLLVIDDIHFLENKPATQLELARMVDILRRRGVQMVFSADRPLSELTGFKPELTTRLESGVSCEIAQPERETLLGIFRQMAESRGLEIPDDVCRFTVSRCALHARQLYGALNRLHAVHLVQGGLLTVESAARILEDITPRRRTVSLEDIERAVAETFNLPPNSLRGRSKTRQVSHPRMLAMWLARKYTRSALSEIGRFFGNRCHSSVATAKKQVDMWLSEAVGEVPLRNGAKGIAWSRRDLVDALRRAEWLLGAEPVSPES